MSLMSQSVWMQLFRMRRMANIILTGGRKKEKWKSNSWGWLRLSPLLLLLKYTAVLVHGRIQTSTSHIHDAHSNPELTDVSGGRVFVGALIEPSCCQSVHLDEGDAATAPLSLRLVDREEGLEEKFSDAFGDWRRIHCQAGKEVVHVANVPELQTEKRSQFQVLPLQLLSTLSVLSLATTLLTFISVADVKCMNIYSSL